MVRPDHAECREMLRLGLPAPAPPRAEAQQALGDGEGALVMDTREFRDVVFEDVGFDNIRLLTLNN